MIHVENVYEEILHQILLDETLKVIKEAAILKKHNLFEDNMALPCESVSSLADLKTPAGSNQASPARRASATMPGDANDESLSNDVFQEPGEKKQPGDPGVLAQGEMPSFSMTSPSHGGEGQAITSSTNNLLVKPVTEEDVVGVSGTYLSELEFGETPEDKDPIHLKLESVSPSDSLKELRNLLTVTVEVPVESAQHEIEKDANKEIQAPPEIEKEKEISQVYTEVNQGAVPSQDNCEESQVSEKEAHSSLREAGGAELGRFPEAQPACRESANGGSNPDHTEEQAEAERPAEQDLTVGACALEGEGLPQEDCVFGSAPDSSRESQVSVGQEEMEGQSSTDQAPAGVEAEMLGQLQATPPRFHECQWVVESAPDPDVLGSQNEGSTPEPPSEE